MFFMMGMNFAHDPAERSHTPFSPVIIAEDERYGNA